jgi:hypothetical protein
MDYMKLMNEYHPERVEFLKVPAKFGPKNTCEELRIWIDDVKTELGKKSALDYVKLAWVEGSKVFERINTAEDGSSRFGLQVQGLGQAAVNSIVPRQMQDGTIVHGPAVPTLAEFAVEHQRWFQSSVNWRMCMMAVEMIAAVHRANTRTNVAKAQQTPISEETEELMKEL